MLNLILLLLGIVLSGVGLFFIILYLNLLVIGYSFFEFVNFIIRSIYSASFFIGLLIIFIAIRRIIK